MQESVFLFANHVKILWLLIIDMTHLIRNQRLVVFLLIIIFNLESQEIKNME